jgi:hypothetical protein
MKNIKKTILFLSILFGVIGHLNSQNTIEFTITKSRNYPNGNQGNQINSNLSQSSNNVNFHVNNARLNGIFNHFKVRKFKPVYTAAYRLDATQKIKPELLAKLKTIYTIECLNCNLEKLKDSLTSFQNDTSFGVINVKLKRVQSSFTPSDYNLQYGPISTDAYFNDPTAWNWHLDKIKAKEAWDISKCSSNVKIAIIDDGFDLIHPEIINKFDYVQPGSTPQNHGTSTAQLAAGETNNGNGLASIGYNARLHLYTTGINSMLNAALDGVRILSNSWIYGTNNDVVDQEIINNITSMGCFIIFASGNGFKNPVPYDPDLEIYPASYNNVFSVSGVWENDAHRYQGLPLAADNSTQQHNSKVDLCAPSYHIWKAAHQIISPITSITYTHTYAWGDGTSFAAPIVAGTVALMLDVNPCLTPFEIEAILKQSADDISGVADNYKYAGKLGAGRLNAFKAVSLAKDWGKVDFTINNGENIYWNTTNKFYKNIYIKSGGILTLNSTQLFMGLNGKIVVEKGAKLFVTNNSIISSHPVSSYLTCFENSYRWQGIQVEGQPSFDQNPTSNQGLVNISNSTIQDANEAISTIGTDVNGNTNWVKTGGGIIISTNSRFTNNNRHIYILSYHRPIINSVEQNNLCKFTNCVFETNETRNISTNNKQEMFKNWDTKGITVNGCTFRNTNNGLNAKTINADRGTGIYTVDASMKIQNILNNVNGNNVSIPSVFYDLQIGIDDYHYTTSPLNGHIIKKNNFDRNIYGIQQTNSNSSHIYRNYFKLEFNNDYPTYTKAGYWGIYSGGFQISENIFENNSTYTTAEIGSAIRSSSANGGARYALNTHIKTRIGSQVEKNNSNLQYYCNDHSYIKYYGLLLDASQFNLFPSFGDCFSADYYTLNTFNSNIGDIYNKAIGYKDYLVKSLIANPDPIASKSINMNYVSCIGRDYGCLTFEPAESTGWINNDNKNPIYIEKRVELIGLQEQFDNGNNPNLLSLINQGTIVPANNLYDTLNKYSPYLSDNILSNMLLTSQHLSETQIVSILISNSPLTSNVNSALSYRSFSQSALDNIGSHQTGTSARTNLENTIKTKNVVLSDLKSDLINYYLAASLNDTLHNYKDSTVLLLQGETDEYSVKQLASIYLVNGQLSLASSKLASLNQNNTENTNYVLLMNILIDLKQNNKNVFQLSNSQEQTIRQISITNTNAAYNAQAILNLVFNEYNVERPTYYTEGLGKSKSSTIIKETTKNIKLKFLSVYPNPTTNILNVDYKCKSDSKNNSLSISNISGAIIKNIVINGLVGQEIIDVSNLSSGVYFIELKNNNETISKVKFVIVK